MKNHARSFDYSLQYHTIRTVYTVYTAQELIQSPPGTVRRHRYCVVSCVGFEFSTYHRHFLVSFHASRVNALSALF